jgi:hypothetical protein
VCQEITWELIVVNYQATIEHFTATRYQALRKSRRVTAAGRARMAVPACGNERVRSLRNDLKPKAVLFDHDPDDKNISSGISN